MLRNIFNLVQILRCLWNRQEGGIIIFFVFFLNAILAFLAVTFGAAMGTNVKSGELNAAAAASLAGAITNGNVPKAMAYFEANFRNGDYGINYSPSDIAIQVTNDRFIVTPTDLDMAIFFPINAMDGPSPGSYSLNVSAQSIASLPDSVPVPKSVMLVLDRSGSMTREDAGPCPVSGTNPCSRLQALRESTFELIDNLEALPNSQTDYSIAGVAWDSAWIFPPLYIEPGYSLPYTSDYATAHDSFDDLLTAGGSTCAFCGLRAANTLLTQSPQAERTVVFMTDGAANSLPPNYTNLVPPGFPPDWTGDNIIDPFRTAAWECYYMKQTYPSISIWTIAFGIDAGNGQPAGGWMGVQLLQYCATAPAQYVFAPDGGALNEVFNNVFASIGKIKLVK